MTVGDNRPSLIERDRQAEPRRCEFCDRLLGEDPWAYWSSDGKTALFCDECADDRRELEEE